MANEMMKYVHYENGGPDNLSIWERSLPELRQGEVLMKVHATAINRADTLQRKGFYPAPPGESKILGLEAAGTVHKLGPGCDQNKWKHGDRVMALLTGGGYAEYVAVPEVMLMPVPAGMSLLTAASIPEVWLTAYQLLFVAGGLQPGETVLIHAGGSGVGTAAVQLCQLAKCTAIVTAGSSSKLDTATDLGAKFAINYKTEDFSEKVLEYTNDKGVDLILDCVGASHFEKNMKSVKTEGRWVLYGLMGGGNISGDILSQLLRKRISLIATTLRARSIEYKKMVVDGFMERVLPLFHEGAAGLKMKPIIDSVFPLVKIADAHKLMESNQNTGKILIELDINRAGNKDEL